MFESFTFFGIWYRYEIVIIYTSYFLSFVMIFKYSNLYRAEVTEREYSGGEGHIVNFSLSWGWNGIINLQNTLFQFPKSYYTM